MSGSVCLPERVTGEASGSCTIPRKHTVELRTGDGSSRTVLGFKEELTGKNQRRLRDRVRLMPEVNLDDYVCTAVIDWIEVRYYTTSRTQWKNVWEKCSQALGKTCHVRGVRGDDGLFREFHVRVQEPEFPLIRAAGEALEASCGLECPPEVKNLEISVDFRPKRPSVDAFARMHGVLTRTHLPNRDVIRHSPDRPRSVWRKGTSPRHVLPFSKKRPERRDDLLLTTELDAPAPVNGTYYTGARNSRSMWRIMRKRLDRQNPNDGSYIELPEPEQRVRIEVTLREDELRNIGIKTLMDLENFKFQTFQSRYFRFRCPTFVDVDSLVPGTRRAITEWLENRRLQRFLNAGVVGLFAMDQVNAKRKKERRDEIRTQLGRPLSSVNRVGRGVEGDLVACESISRRVGAALSRLGERVRLS